MRLLAASRARRASVIAPRFHGGPSVGPHPERAPQRAAARVGSSCDTVCRADLHPRARPSTRTRSCTRRRRHCPCDGGIDRLDAQRLMLAARPPRATTQPPGTLSALVHHPATARVDPAHTHSKSACAALDRGDLVFVCQGPEQGLGQRCATARARRHLQQASCARPRAHAAARAGHMPEHFTVAALPVLVLDLARSPATPDLRFGRRSRPPAPAPFRRCNI
jgi:hypothetical protein